MKTTKSYFAILLSALFFTACASTHPGIEGRTVSATPDLKLHISAKWNEDYSDESNIFVDFTFQNLTGAWAHIDQVDVDFVTSNGAPHNLIVGNDLKAWAESYTIRNRKSEYNTQLGIAGLIAAGAVLMVAAAASGGGSGSSEAANGLATAGIVAYSAGVGAGVYHGVSKEFKSVQRGYTVPESHILAPVTIPSTGFAQKWMLLNVPSGVKYAAPIMRLRIHTVEGGEGIFEIPLEKSTKRNNI